MHNTFHMYISDLARRTGKPIYEAMCMGFEAVMDSTIPLLYNSEPVHLDIGMPVGTIVPATQFDMLFKSGMRKDALLELLLNYEAAGGSLDDYLYWCTPAAMKEFLMQV